MTIECVVWFNFDSVEIHSQANKTFELLSRSTDITVCGFNKVCLHSD